MHRAIAVALVLVVQAAAQQADWTSVRSLQPGQRVMFVTHKRDVVEATVARWSAAGLDVARGKTTQSFALADIRSVRVQEKGSRWKSAMWGALAGFAITFPCGAAKAGYITDQNDPSFATRMGVGAAVGVIPAGIGAAIGALIGGNKYVTVYDASGRNR